MRYLAFILLALQLVACAPVEQVHSAPPGRFQITEFEPDGSVKQTHITRSFQESGLPPKVTFTDRRGKKVTISGSYLIQRR